MSSSRRLQLALDELKFFTEELTMLGTYPAHPSRTKLSQGA